MSRTKGAMSGTGIAGGTPSRDFAEYCAAEFERRRNSGEGFDEAAYRASMEIALKRLQLIEEAGLT